jgi:hypothetical protein
MSKATQFIAEDIKEAARLLTEPLAVGYFEARNMLEHNRYTMRMDSMFRLGLFSVRELLFQSKVISSSPMNMNSIRLNFWQRLILSSSRSKPAATANPGYPDRQYLYPRGSQYCKTRSRPSFFSPG